ncbi:hypothetical protein INT44_004067 [Umbelopsis vinacea]|uniref:HTH TFE/IIEalpha-type domain-containing protein n=1 Tax=Umbelopsis vinacea TaxID=44442 RepID=A0A8H7QBQ8_9FUNG|nr:hypothetical protein INT44_004067 [Umbelopsis vinacea]
MSQYDVLKTMVARVARAFYDPKYIVVLDALNKIGEHMKEEDLSINLKLTLRELHKLCAKLREDRLVRIVQKQEARAPDQRAVPKTYYYIDYKQFVNVVKWKMYKMQTSVRDTLRTESENKGYVCPNCQRTYPALEAVGLISMTDGLFHCEDCDAILEENDNAENVKYSQEVLARLREQCLPIISLLKQTDSLVIPASYVIRTSAGLDGNGNNKANGDDDGHELAIAQDTGAGQGEIIVDLQMDNEAARRAKISESNKKRQQNALPVWHQQSTISAPLKGTGDRENAVEESDSDEEDQFEAVENEEYDQDRADYYAKYYDSLNELAANTEPISSEVGQGLINDDEDTGLEVVGSKRGFDDDAEASDSKRQRQDSADEDDTDNFDDIDTEVTKVSVNGRLVPLHEITEDDQLKMTTEEYQASVLRGLRSMGTVIQGELANINVF